MPLQSNNLPKAPSSIIETLPIPGMYSGKIPNIDTSFWDGQKRRRRLQRKAWLFVGAFVHPYYAGLAIVDAGLFGSAFAYLYNADTEEFTEEKLLKPLAFPYSFQPQINSDWEFGPPQKHWRATKSKTGWLITFAGKTLNLELRLVEQHQGLSTIANAKGRPFNYTYKNASLQCLLTGSANGTDFQQEGKFGTLDFSKGYPPRLTYWNWANFCGQTKSKVSVACNLVAEHNNGLENCIWWNDKIIPVSQAVFHYETSSKSKKWNIHTVDGAIECEFTPLGARSENIKAGVLHSKFTQPFGRFKGKLRINGKIHDFKADGVTEEHSAKW